MIMDTDLRRRRIRDKVPMTFVTAEPYIGHLGVGGVGDTKGVLEAEMRQRHIKWIVNAKVDKVDADKVCATEVDEDGKPKKTHEVPFKFSMMIPAFRGIAALREIEGLTNRGASSSSTNISAILNSATSSVSECASPFRRPSRPLFRAGCPRQEFMIKSMVMASALNIGQLVRGQAMTHEATWNAICPGRLRQFRRSFRRHAAKSATQRQLGLKRPLGPCRQSGVREVLPAQGSRGHDGAVLRKARDEILDIGKIKMPAA